MAGRPIGSTESPQSILKSEMKNSSRTMGKVRELIEEQMELIRADLKTVTDPAVRVSVVQMLVEVVQPLSGSIAAAAKALDALRKSENPSDDKEESGDDILNGLIG